MFFVDQIAAIFPGSSDSALKSRTPNIYPSTVLIGSKPSVESKSVSATSTHPLPSRPCKQWGPRLNASAFNPQSLRSSPVHLPHQTLSKIPGTNMNHYHLRLSPTRSNPRSSQSACAFENRFQKDTRRIKQSTRGIMSVQSFIITTPLHKLLPQQRLIADMRS